MSAFFTAVIQIDRPRNLMKKYAPRDLRHAQYAHRKTTIVI